MEDLFAIKQAAFVTSVAAAQQGPERRDCEIAIVGRSNAGKSTLINSICGSGKLAKTSSTPGKTRLINYFLCNRSFYLVDLPGYGFAKTAKAEQNAWGALIGDYLASGRVTHIIMLLDIRHAPSAEDRQMYEYLLYYGLPFTLVATKADKLPRSKRKQAACQAAKLLGAPPYAIPFSGVESEGKTELVKRIGQILADTQEK